MQVVLSQLKPPKFDKGFFVPIAVGTSILLVARPIISMTYLKCLEVRGSSRNRVREIVQKHILHELNDPKEDWATLMKVIKLGAFQFLVAFTEELIFRVPVHYLGKHLSSKGKVRKILITIIVAHFFSMAHNKHQAWFRDYFWSGEYSLYLITGFVFSSVYEKTDSLFASVLTHALVNMAVLSPPYGALNVLLKKKIYCISS